MAKNSTPQANDPAALAFSAVEDALKESVFNIEDAKPAPEKKPAEPPPRSERARTADRIAAQASSVANDDRFSPQRTPAALQNRSSATPTWIALVLSVIWLIATGVAGYLRFQNQLQDVPAFVGTLDFIALLAIMVVPVLGFFAVATLVRRAQDLRNAASSITQAAIRLAEPEVTAAEKVASVGQAVRREVNALGDGLERALSRAGELEVMIHNEVTALEKTYSENESRMRALIAELASQRENVLTNTEKVREAITESHTGLVFDLDMISQRIAGTIVDSGGNLTKALETAGNTMTTGFAQGTENFVNLIDNRTSDFLASIDDSASRLAQSIEDRSSAATRDFETRTQDLSTTIEARMTALTEALDQRTTTFSSAIEAHTGALSTALETRTDALSTAIEERTATLSDSIDSRAASLSSAIDQRTASLSNTIDRRTTSLSDAIEERTASLSDTIERRTASLSESIDERTSALSGAIEERTSALSTVLSDSGNILLDQLRDRGNEVSGALDTIGTRIAEDITGRSREAEVLLNALTRQLDESVSIQLNSLESRLQSALIEINGALDETADKARVTISTAGADSLSEFDTRLTQITTGIDERLHTLDGVVGDKGEKLIAALSAQSETFANRANSLEAALEEKAGRFTEAVAERTREMDEAIDTRARQLTDTFASASREVADSLEGHTMIISEALDSRTEKLNDALAARTQELETTLESRTSELDSAIAARTGTLGETIATQARRLDETIGNRTSVFADVITERTETLSSRLEERTTALADSLDDHTHKLAGTVGSHTQALSEALGQRTEQLSDALGQRTEQLSEILASRTEEVSRAIGERTTELGKTIELQGMNARDRIDTSLRGVTDTMEERVSTMSGLISGKVAEVNDSLGRGIDDALVRITDAENGVISRIEGASSTVGESARQAADIIETGVNSARKAITDMVDQRLGTLPEAITARADITADRLTALNQAINTSITQSMADLEAGADRIEETITNRLSTATQSIVADVGESTDRMDTAVRRALEQIQVAASSIDELVSIKATGAADAIVTRMSEANRSINEQTEALSSLVSQKSAQLEDALANHGNVLREALENNAREAETIMSVSTSRIMTDVTSALGKLNDSNLLLQRVLDASTSNLANLESSVAQQTAAYSDTVRDAIGQTEQAGQMVSQHVSALQATIHGMVEEFGSVLGRLDSETASMAEVANTLSNSGNFALETLEERRGAMDALASTFTARADDIDGRMRLFAQSIADTVNDTERRLIGARRAMDEALNATSSGVTEAIESATLAVNEALSNTSANVSHQLYSTEERVNHALTSTSERVTETLNATSNQVDTALLRASDSAAASMRQNANVVNDALAQSAERVNAALSETSERVGDVLSVTSSSLSDSINDSTVAVRNAIASHTGSLRNALDSTSEQVVSRIGEFRETADTEGQRANDSMRQAQQAMIEEMQRALQDATLRFNDTARAMRETAKEVGSELEATRSELARGVTELPEETRASAAAMRRVVAEQIEALSELNAIVRAQPATRDLNDRAAPAPAPRQSSYRPEMPRPQVSYREQAPVAVAPAQQPVQGEEGGGWLRDVLRNATAKQAGGQPGGSNLSGLTDEIAQAIEDGALADAWTRYQAGESNVFSRRIYSLAGQGTYDEVRRRLQREPEFERTARAYMSEFEQLLRRAAAGPRAAADTREYLLSDRGKVYTMLAHASGRLN